MPRGPQGQRRPADAVSCAVAVAKISTGEIDDPKPSRGRNDGLVGGKARAEAVSPERRSEIARDAADARWAKRSLQD
jgi:hypothetical protein